MSDVRAVWAPRVFSDSEEIWAPVPLHERYEASTFGRVRLANSGAIKPDSGHNQGYRSIYLDGIKMLVHRVIAATFLPNPDHLPQVDHIDQDKSNNNLSNLRYATYADNHYNHRGNPRASSIYRGVSWHALARKWRARITVDGVDMSLGMFDVEIDAAAAWNRVAQANHGDFYSPNVFNDADASPASP